MRLSVIIPVHNVCKTLRECVDSVRMQGYSDMEVILVDDGSTDDSGRLCDIIASTWAQVSVIHKMNGGLSDARNAGLDKARGEYVTFIDSDDMMGKDTIVTLMDIIDRHPDYDMLEYPVCRHYGTNHQQICSFGENEFTDIKEYWNKTKGFSHTYACNKFYKRELFDEIRFPKGFVFEDAWTIPRILEKCSVVATCEKGLYLYTDNPKGITAKASGADLEMLLDAHLTTMDKPWANGNDEFYMHVVNIQMDVFEMTGKPPKLKTRRIWDFKNLNIKLSIKAIILNLLGIRLLCKTNKYLHKVMDTRS